MLVSKSDIVYNRFKELLARNEIVPGQKIQLLDFARRLNVSSTPLREALSKLAQEGYVVQYANRGYYVTQIGIRESEEIFDARRAIEIFSIERAVEKITKRDLEELRYYLARYKKLVREGAHRQRFILDHQFHLRMVKISGNETLWKMLERILEKLILKRKMDYVSVERGPIAYREHRSILSALEKKEKKSLIRNLKIHLDHAKRDFIQSLKKSEETL